MPLMLKRVRDAMLASGAAHAAPSAAAAPERPPVTPSGDAPTPSTSDLEISGVVSDPPKAPVQTMPPTPTPVEPLPVDVHPKPDTERDTRSSDHVELHPTHPWFTHHPNSSPVSFAKKYPPTGVTPHSTEWVYAYSLSPQGAPVPPASEGNFSGKWMVMCVPSNELDTKWQQVCAAVEAGEVSAAKVVPGGEGTALGVSQIRRHTVLPLTLVTVVHTSRYTRLTLSFIHRKRTCRNQEARQSSRTRTTFETKRTCCAPAWRSGSGSAT
jgi:hypothetical protein